ncbi:oxidoreductase [Thermoplasmatales archaeon SG8-52-2]|nr:MAG: oxidoreductase [Thermoplasmatales archaeon SG8-52-2]
MINLDYDVAVIGAGPAGLAAAISARENSAKKVIILDRNSWLGGILPQCIHDGFGVEEIGISMTGPEYAEMYIKNAENSGVSFLRETMVLSLSKNLEIIAVNNKGLHKIRAKAIVLAMGCREKTRWNVMIPGDRPSGIFTAGVAQGFINLYNKMVGKNVVILGSGDVGLIVARRLKFEGANVLGVVEILPYPSGLPRNVVQCLDDYDIPLYLNHTVTYIKGKDRLESVTIAQVNENMKIISGTEKTISCDTLLLSLGLIPENELSKQVGIEIDEITGGPIVDQFFETTISGIFACGNCLQVYDTVDVLSIGAKLAGKNAALYAARKNVKVKEYIKLSAGKGIRYVIPQKINKPGVVHINLRVKKPRESAKIYISDGEKEIFKKKLPWANPANMIDFDIDIKKEIFATNKDLEVSLYDK